MPTIEKAGFDDFNVFANQHKLQGRILCGKRFANDSNRNFRTGQANTTSDKQFLDIVLHFLMCAPPADTSSSPTSDIEDFGLE
jgi:hypothetical protein